jgi:small-conductance mechanosensitive channel
MKKKTISVCLGQLVWLLPLFVCLHVGAQQPSATRAASQSTPAGVASEAPEEIISPGLVVIEGRTILTVYESVGSFTPEQRASAIVTRIISFAAKGGSPDAIRLQPHDAWTEIFVDNVYMMAVTDADARMAGKAREQLATENADNIRLAIHNYRRDHSWRFILRGLLDTGIGTIVLAFVLWLIRRIRFALRSRVESHIYTSAHLETKSAWHVSVAYVGRIALALGGIARWLLILAVFQAYLTVTLGFFSFTREISLSVTRWVFSQLGMLGRSAVGYLPNLVVIAVIALITYYLFRLLRLISGEISKGELKIRGFYPDWAEPTEKLIRMLLLVFALIAAFPYFPGAKSPAFQGISIFLGVLLSLGSSSAVANAVAGVILTYMRSFLVGDWVQIGDVTGEVVEKNLLVTRVLTPKAEIITIPNANVMSGSVKNYSVEAKKSGVIFHITVTIGYDAPWRTVHQLLISAALATDHVRQQPYPFVLQTRLDDFYVAYELNAYTDIPREMLSIYSDLHKNIQDKFNEAGVEICSPHFSSLRDGNVIAIPQQYIKPDYQAPAFRVNAVAEDGESSAKASQVVAARRTG